MAKTRLLSAGSSLAAVLSVGFIGVGQQALAQDAVEPDDEIVVTGSYIRGTPEDAAIPVDVITAETLQEQGSPTLTQLIRTIPSNTGGNYGESNRFLGNGAAAVATVNLRGLGATRTLSLMNGERLATITAPGGAEFVNVNVVPQAAIGRVEVLRDGAAATYGSDAVAGVVNFITRRDLDGLEVAGSYTAIKGSEGDYDSSVAYGWVGDRSNVLIAGSYRRRSELEGRDLPWTLWSGAPAGEANGLSGANNPGTYQAILGAPTIGPNGGFLPTPGNPTVPLGGTLSASFRDAGCGALGAVPSGTASCFYPYTYHDNRISDEYHYHLFGEVNAEFADNLRFHAEALWARSDVPRDRVSASQSTVLFPTPIEASGGSPGGGTSYMPAGVGATQSRYYVPATNPGLQALFAPCPTATEPQITAAICAGALANGVTMVQTGWRPEAMGGNTFTGDADLQSNQITSFRVVAGLEGDFANDWGWSTSVNYMRTQQVSLTPDRMVNRIQLALRGLGGANCNGIVAGSPGSTCEWFNPFANTITRSIVNGQSYNGATGLAQGPDNSRALWSWIQQNAEADLVQQLFTAQAVFNGDFGDFELGGGPVQWAAGVQYRYNDRTIDYSANFDAEATPCVDSPPYGDGTPSCTVPGTGPFLFIGNGIESSLDRNVTAAFAELNLPVFDSFEISAAVRHEEYGGNIGSTTTPRISARWQVLPWIALRGSAGSTFRAPPSAAIAPGSGRIQAQFTNPVTGAALYRPVDTFGNPALTPETADTYNVGFLIEAGGFRAQIDYFGFKFQDEITTETAARIYGTMFAASNNPALWQCNTPELAGRFTFGAATDASNTNTFDYNGAAAGGVFPNCHPSNFLAVRSNVINGPETQVSGVDLNASYTFDDIFGGMELTLGGDASYLLEFDRGAAYLLGTNIIYDAALDRAGKSELLSAFYSYPQLRGNLYANLSFADGAGNLRWTTRYWEGTVDRNDTLAPTFEKRDDRWVHDLTYRQELPWDTTLTATIANIADDRPPFIRSQYNYDYVTQSPLGRTFEIGFNKRF